MKKRPMARRLSATIATKTEKAKKLVEVFEAVLIMGLIIWCLVILFSINECAVADPLPPQLTRCSNGTQVITVENHTCPAGYWPV